MESIVFVLYWIATVLLAAVGIGAAIAPRFLASNFGVPTSDKAAIVFVRAAGTRDITLALMFVVIGLRGDIAIMIGCSAVVAILAVGDFFLALIANDGRFKITLLSHLAGAVGFAVLAILLHLFSRS